MSERTTRSLRSLLDRLTATERYPVDHKTVRREYRGIELTTSVEIAYDDVELKHRAIACVAVTDDGETIARESSQLTVGEAPRWFGLFGGDFGFVPSTSAHALTVIEPVREAVDEFFITDEDIELAAAFDVELEDLDD